jgi:hypothetical protein
MNELSFTKQKEQARNIKNKIDKNVLISSGEDYKFLIEFFKEHPSYNSKFGNGCIGFVKKNVIEWGKLNECLYVVDNDLNEISISVNYSKKVNKKAEVMKAFRQSIFVEIKKFKESFIPNETRCAISDKVLVDIYNVDIDHHNLDFIEIVSFFMIGKSFEDLFNKVVYDKTITLFSDDELIQAFISFHNNNTTLRFVDKTIHKTKQKTTFNNMKILY